MYLKEVRIHGFKSFADTTYLNLRPGVTAIVGPNGCGKSNIADCIRWVLGEQSAKALRGGKMQDVIFEGTDKRKPHSICEVSLTFSDCEADLGEEFHEVEIRRKVVRDGGSSYYINGKACRLKDIAKLFMDTGVGQVSYSFMVQGQIDQILSSNPAERRTIFEEAAGITRYKAQRKEALNKLSHVDANLSRVTDVIEEVGRQIGSLKRQASKALRYKRLSHRLKHLDLSLSSRQYKELEGVLKNSTESSRDFTVKVDELKKSLAEKELGLSRQREDRGIYYTELQERQQHLFDLRSERDQSENQAKLAKVRIQDTEERLVQIRQELEGLEQRKAEIMARSEGSAETKQQQMDLMGDSDAMLRERNEALAEVQSRMSETEALLQRERQAIGGKEMTINRLRAQVSSLEVELRTNEVKHSNLNEDIYRMRDEQAVVENQLRELEYRLENLEGEKTEVENQVKTAEEDVNRLRGEFRNTQAGIQEMDRQLARMAAHLNVLNDLNKKFEGFSEGAKAILQGRIEAVVDPGEFQLMAKNLKVEAENTKAVEGLLGASLDALLVESAELAGVVVKQLNIRQLGKACLQFPIKPPARSGEMDAPDFLKTARSLVDSDDYRTCQALDSILSGTYVCESLEAFINWWKDHQEFDFVRVSDLSGDSIDRRGYLVGGHSKSQPDSILERSNQIRELKQRIESLETVLEGKRAQARELDEQMEAADRLMQENQKRLQEISREESVLNSEQRNAEMTRGKTAQRLEEAEASLARMEENRSGSEQRLEGAKVELSSAEADLEGLRSQISGYEEQVASLRSDRESKLEALSEVRVELAAKKQALESLEASLRELERQSLEIENAKLRRSDELKVLEEQLGSFKEQVVTNDALVKDLALDLEEAQVSVNQTRQKLNEVEEEINKVESGLSGIRKELHDLESSLNKEEVKLAEKRSRMRYLAEEIFREYDLELEHIDWRRELFMANQKIVEKLALDLEEEEATAPDPDASPDLREPSRDELEAVEEPDWDLIRDEVETIRKRVHSMGPVNLVAIEEYGELKERHDFLKNQSDDLWNSKEQLLAAIDEINQTSLAQFKETFAKVKENFDFTFNQLFGGGVSNLTLIDAEDPLESGIEIVAQPPGTRLKSISLLSGGQKTMTAVALLFAIYMVKPSPFCLLDELDAPLDEANIGRFTGMLKTFTEHSQFLIISHNKRTIASADTIYGVTMQEKGVSKLLSMRFNRDTGKAEEVELASAQG